MEIFDLHIPFFVAHVFVHQQQDGSKKCMSLWTVPADGSAPARAFTRGRNDSEPQFSPDGCTVAFIGGEKEEAPQVYLIPTAGGESFPLTTLPEGRIHSLVFAPDGESIAFSFRAQDPEWTAEKVEALNPLDLVVLMHTPELSPAQVEHIAQTT